MTNFKFPPRRNYTLCELNFKEKPYCNQMGGCLDETIRFCDVCKRNWKFIDGYIVETTRKEYKISDLEVGSVWMLDRTYPKWVKILEIDENEIKTQNERGEIYQMYFNWVNKNIMPVIRRLTEEDVMNYTNDAKIWRER